MSHGQVVEQGTHNDLYGRDGMYRGLVDAQRISAERTDGYITPEEEEDIRPVESSPGQEVSSPLRGTNTGHWSISKNSNAGVVAQTKYPFSYLIKKVRYLSTD